MANEAQNSNGTAAQPVSANFNTLISQHGKRCLAQLIQSKTTNESFVVLHFKAMSKVKEGKRARFMIPARLVDTSKDTLERIVRRAAFTAYIPRLPEAPAAK